MNRARSFSCRYVLAVAGVLIAATIGACSADAEPDEVDADDATSTTVEATSTTLSETEQVEAAFLAFNDMSDRLAADPDPTDPEIVARTSGEVRAGITDSLTTFETLGYRTEFGERDSVNVLEVRFDDAATAKVLECSVEDRMEITPAGTSGPFLETYWTEWTLLAVNGEWIVDRGDPVDMREGEHPCE